MRKQKNSLLTKKRKEYEMMKKEVFIVNAQCGGDHDQFYYVFNEHYYYNLFLECCEYLNRSDETSIISLIENCKAVDETFDWIDDSEISEIASSLDDLFEGTYTCIDGVMELIELVRDVIISEETEVYIP